jgi:L,D-peptidoglycan transpeptidase YkuD (ErfK/YbiS/YcfS/YnhG family)
MDIVVCRQGEITIADWGAGPRRCAIGRAGIAGKIREGDGVTPAGTWVLRNVLYRADRIARPPTILPTAPIETDSAWCDVPDDPNYNRLVRLPYASLDERLWREDALYDLIAVIGFNDAPVVPGKGSAIFLHLARADYGETQGCIALALDDLTQALAQLRIEDRLVVRK